MKLESAPAEARVATLIADWKNRYKDAEDRVATLEAALRELDEAVANEGPRPDWHQITIARVRAEWPTLWAAVEVCRAALGEQAPDESS